MFMSKRLVLDRVENKTRVGFGSGSGFLFVFT
jgi:hypothetical protein